MIRLALALGVVGALALAGLSCGGGDSSTQSVGSSPRVKQEIGRERAAARHHARVVARRVAQRHHARVLARRYRRAEVQQLRAEEAAQAAAEQVAAEEAEEAASECDPNYAGACLDPYAYDYDCANGSGDGPEYTGTVTVVGEDHYGLDADSDGIGCELG